MMIMARGERAIDRANSNQPAIGVRLGLAGIEKIIRPLQDGLLVSLPFDVTLLLPPFARLANA
jgi:hypothetical protein